MTDMTAVRKCSCSKNTVERTLEQPKINANTNTSEPNGITNKKQLKSVDINVYIDIMLAWYLNI